MSSGGVFYSSQLTDPMSVSSGNNASASDPTLDNQLQPSLEPSFSTVLWVTETRVTCYATFTLLTYSTYTTIKSVPSLVDNETVAVSSVTGERCTDLASCSGSSSLHTKDASSPSLKLNTHSESVILSPTPSSSLLASTHAVAVTSGEEDKSILWSSVTPTIKLTMTSVTSTFQVPLSSSTTINSVSDVVSSYVDSPSPGIYTITFEDLITELANPINITPTLTTLRSPVVTAAVPSDEALSVTHSLSSNSSVSDFHVTSSAVAAINSTVVKYPHLTSGIIRSIIDTESTVDLTRDFTLEPSSSVSDYDYLSPHVTPISHLPTKSTVDDVKSVSSSPTNNVALSSVASRVSSTISLMTKSIPDDEFEPLVIHTSHNSHVHTLPIIVPFPSARQSMSPTQLNPTPIGPLLSPSRVISTHNSLTSTVATSDISSDNKNLSSTQQIMKSMNVTSLDTKLHPMASFELKTSNSTTVTMTRKVSEDKSVILTSNNALPDENNELRVTIAPVAVRTTTTVAESAGTTVTSPAVSKVDALPSSLSPPVPVTIVSNSSTSLYSVDLSDGQTSTSDPSSRLVTSLTTPTSTAEDTVFTSSTVTSTEELTVSTLPSSINNHHNASTSSVNSTNLSITPQVKGNNSDSHDCNQVSPSSVNRESSSSSSVNHTSSSLYIPSTNVYSPSHGSTNNPVHLLTHSNSLVSWLPLTLISTGILLICISFICGIIFYRKYRNLQREMTSSLHSELISAKITPIGSQIYSTPRLYSTETILPVSNPPTKSQWRMVSSSGRSNKDKSEFEYYSFTQAPSTNSSYNRTLTPDSYSIIPLNETSVQITPPIELSCACHRQSGPVYRVTKGVHINERPRERSSINLVKEKVITVKATESPSDLLRSVSTDSMPDTAANISTSSKCKVKSNDMKSERRVRSSVARPAIELVSSYPQSAASIIREIEEELHRFESVTYVQDDEKVSHSSEEVRGG